VGVLSLPFLTAAALAGAPLFYWGARPPASQVAAPEGSASRTEASVVEVHTALAEDGDLLLRFTFDRPVYEATHAADGRPVSGRLQATVYLDSDDDRGTGLDAGPSDLRTGADRRLTVGVLSLGEDEEEGRPDAAALIVVGLSAVTGDFFERALWRADDETHPERVSWRGEWLELRLPGSELALEKGARLVLAQGGLVSGGRLIP